MTIAAGSGLGPYEILSALGAGGMGEVWRARDMRLNREVAIKVLPASLAGEEDRLRRFEQEARATSALNHPNILTVHDFGTHDGSPYIVAEQVKGETLDARSDIFSFGVLLYEMIGGHHPFAAATPAATISANLAGDYNDVGRYEQVIEEAREAVRLNPTLPSGYSILANAFRSLNRFDEAKEIYEQALAQKLDQAAFHAGLYTIGFVRGDTAAMQQQLDWARGKPNEYVALFWQSTTAKYLGQLRRARELNQRGVDAQHSNVKENAAGNMSTNALRAALTGNCQQAREDIARASALPRTVQSFFGMGTALALCGGVNRGEEGIREDEMSLGSLG